jgi:L,D-transpeptidase ErfK/SrfK
MNYLQSLLLSLLVVVFAATPAFAVYRQVVEEDITYKAVKGDYLCKISGMNGIDCSRFLKENPKKNDKVKIGETFRITRRTIIPDALEDGIMINIPDRTLYLFRDGKLAAHYPVALGKRTWQTPLGAFTVNSKRLHPTWRVPVSIQKEMAKNGEQVKTEVLPGKDNPLGDCAVGTSINGVLIHSTIWPESIYGFRSHGCIRLKPADAEAFYKAAKIRDKGIIIYEPVKLARTENGRVFLEVHLDIYGKTGDLLAEAERQIKGAGLSDIVDAEKVRAVATAKEGVAADVTKSFTP